MIDNFQNLAKKTLDYIFNLTEKKYKEFDVDFEGEIYLSEIIHDYKDIMNLFDNEEDDNDRICATNTHGGGQLCPEAEP